MRLRLFLITVIVLWCTYSVFATDPATDPFTYADGKLTTVSSGKWVENFTGGGAAINVASNAVIDANNQDVGNYWGADTFSADQYSQAKITVTTTQDNHAVSVRNASAAKTFYACDAGLNHEIDKFAAGMKTNLKTVTVTINTNDVLKCMVSGSSTSTITYWVNGVQIDTVSDSSSPITTGQPGLFMSTTDGKFDDWQGGSNTVSSTSVCKSMMMGVGC